MRTADGKGLNAAQLAAMAGSGQSGKTVYDLMLNELRAKRDALLPQIRDGLQVLETLLASQAPQAEKNSSIRRFYVAALPNGEWADHARRLTAQESALADTPIMDPRMRVNTRE